MMRSPRLQHGAALVSALITVALVVILSAGLVAQQSLAVQTMSGRHDLAEARWLARAAVDWARNVLAEDAQSTQEDHLGEIWATRIPPLPVLENGAGELAGEIEDQSGRFNLNNLRLNGAVNPKQKVALHRLMENAGIPAATADQLCNTLADWLDRNDQPLSFNSAETAYYVQIATPYRAANAPLDDVADLLRIRGYTPALVERLKPFITVLPAQPGLNSTPVNVNTAAPEVLAAVVQGLSLDAARVLVAERNRRWFALRGGDRLDDFRGRLPSGATPIDGVPLDVRSQWFIVSGRARYGEALTQMRVLLFRPNILGAPWPTVVWQRLL